MDEFKKLIKDSGPLYDHAALISIILKELCPGRKQGATIIHSKSELKMLATVSARKGPLVVTDVRDLRTLYAIEQDLSYTPVLSDDPGMCGPTESRVQVGMQLDSKDAHLLYWMTKDSSWLPIPWGVDFRATLASLVNYNLIGNHFQGWKNRPDHFERGCVNILYNKLGSMSEVASLLRHNIPLEEL